jgi:hypothetical protein
VRIAGIPALTRTAGRRRSLRARGPAVIGVTAAEIGLALLRRNSSRVSLSPWVSKPALSADCASLERIRLAFKFVGDNQENAIFMMPALCRDACHRSA